ncbi:MAG: hypothetical protein N2646_06325 [Bellilinea sp.]|nr:hypothetical protein [Bellilinea sp.]
MRLQHSVLEDIELASQRLISLPTSWDGKESILELKIANYNWRQMEWWSFYFEYLCFQNLSDQFQIPGDRFGRVKTASFDLKRTINWDLKAKAIKSDDHRSILNDMAAIQQSIQQYGAHGLIIGLCDVEYNDNDRTFQKWHEDLKGGKSKYEIERLKRTSISRYRKTRADLKEILFVVINTDNERFLEIYHQGRNSNGQPRPPKYMLNYEKVERFLVKKLSFPDPA